MAERLACDSPHVSKMMVTNNSSFVRPYIFPGSFEDLVGHRGWKVLFEGDMKDENASGQCSGLPFACSYEEWLALPEYYSCDNYINNPPDLLLLHALNDELFGPAGNGLSYAPWWYDRKW